MTLDRQLEIAIELMHHLLVNVTMFGKPRSRCDAPEHEGHRRRMKEPSFETGDDHSGLEFFPVEDLVERCCCLAHDGSRVFRLTPPIARPGSGLKSTAIWSLYGLVSFYAPPKQRLR